METCITSSVLANSFGGQLASLQSLIREDEAQEQSIMDQILHYISSLEFQKSILGATKSTRKTEKRPDYWNSEWGKLVMIECID